VTVLIRTRLFTVVFGCVCYSQKVKVKKARESSARYADMFGALGNEVRLDILRLLLSAHPEGLVVGDIQAELTIPPSTLSHHLEKLRHEDLVAVRRDTKFLWYTANVEALQQLLGFLYAECCSRSKVIAPSSIPNFCK